MFGSRTDGLSRPLVTRQFARAGAVVVAAFLVASLFTGIPARPVLAAPAGTGLQFDGTNDYVTFGSSASLGVTNFTVELWFKRTGTGVGMPTSGGTGGLARCSSTPRTIPTGARGIRGIRGIGGIHGDAVGAPGPLCTGVGAAPRCVMWSCTNTPATTGGDGSS